MVREMISPKLKDFTSRHWAGKVGCAKSVEILIRVYFAAEDCSKPFL